MKATAIRLPLSSLRDKTIANAALVLFVDDFQAPTFCSQFRMTLNGVRFPEAELALNALLQTGPIGKLVWLPLTPNLLEVLRGDELEVLIDDPTTHAADGFAIDFMKLLVNYRKEFSCIGKLSGFVRDDETSEPIAGATVEVGGFGQVTTDADGWFVLDRLPAGLQVATATAPGYEAGSKAGDVWDGGGEEIEIRLKRGSSAVFNGQTIRAGESVIINNILFDVGSAVLRPESKTELDKVVGFLRQNPRLVLNSVGTPRLKAATT
jgi:hypothetical protein